MYYIIRIILVILAFYKSFRKATENEQRKKKYMLGALAIVIMILISFVPVENLFLRFDTPEKAYQYVELGKSEVLTTIDGNESTMVVALKNGSETNLVMPKAGEKWKAGIAVNSPLVGKLYTEEVSINVYTYKKTADFYLTVSASDFSEIEISDGNGTVFTPVKYDSDEFGTGLTTYYAYLPSLSGEYNLTVNGEQLTVNVE